jgi:hypothetical protein
MWILLLLSMYLPYIIFRYTLVNTDGVFENSAQICCNHNMFDDFYFFFLNNMCILEFTRKAGELWKVFQTKARKKCYDCCGIAWTLWCFKTDCDWSLSYKQFMLIRYFCYNPRKLHCNYIEPFLKLNLSPSLYLFFRFIHSTYFLQQHLT